MQLTRTLSSVALLSLSLLAAPAWSVPVGYSIGFAAETVGGASLGSADQQTLSSILDQNGEPSTGESVFLTQTWDSGNGWSVNGFLSTRKTDPYITNDFTVVNNTGSTAVFTFSVSTPIPAFNAGQIVQSNILLQINDDNNVGGAMAASASGIDVYRATVNGSTVLSLLPANYSLSCASPTDCSPPGVANGQDGDEVVSMGFGPVNATEIGIIVRFSLSAGDSASVLSRFEIVPEPSTAVLLGLGLGVLAARRRRQ